MRSVFVSLSLTLLITGVVVVRPIAMPSSASYIEDPPQMQEIQRDWTINIILVNYDSDDVEERALHEFLPDQRQYEADVCDITYTMQYEVHYADADYIESIRNLIINNHVNGTETGSILDESALEYQKAHPDEPQKIFYPRSGMSIEAEPIEEWLIENPATSSDKLHYNLYLFNFSEFDSPEHELEHWYDYDPVDPDSGEDIDWWRLPWDNQLNRDIKFQYAGFGGMGNVFVVDPSADQWYLRWARIWWGTEPYSEDPRHCTEDLEDVVDGIDLSTSEGRLELSAYLANYLSDAVRYLFFPVQHSPTAFVQRGILTALVLAMDTDEGITVRSLEWVTNAELLENHLSELLPFIPWNVSVQVRDSKHFPYIMGFFDGHSYVTDGHTYVNGYDLFYDIYDNVRWRYIDVASDDIEVFGVVFIKQNMTMYTPTGYFTGLGGGGQTCVWKSWERYYRDDGTTKREGISGVQLHETMHAIGMGHTWVRHHYVGDFSSSPMVYFGMHNGTSSFDKNWVQGTYLDQLEFDYYDRLLEAWDDIKDEAEPETYQILDDVLNYYELAHERYKHMDWQGCYEALELANQEKRYMVFSVADDSAPTIWDWGYEPEEYREGNVSVWVDVSDDIAGIKNVSAVLGLNETTVQYACSYEGSSWNATFPVPSFDPECGVKLMILAYDRGLNPASTDWVTLVEPVTSPPDGTYMLYVIVFGVPFALILVVVATIWYRKSKQAV